MTKTLTPANESELSALVKRASRNGTPLSVIGGGTRPIGNPSVGGDILSTRNIGGISLYEPGALTIVAASGTPLEEITQTLARENQHLPFEPADYSALLGTTGTSTIGGVVGAAVSGPRRIQAGSCRDSLIGVRFVDGEGNIIKNGGRVMKNVTGYDLVKLMCGSFGTLGVLSEVAFKVLPKPEMTGVIKIYELQDELAISALSRALTSPFDVSGAAHLQKDENGNSLTLIRVEGFSESVRYRTERLKDLLKPMLAKGSQINVELDQKENHTLWRSVRDVAPFHNRSGSIWRLSTKPGDGPKIVADLSDQMQLEALYDWGGGLVWLLVSKGNMSAQAGVIRNRVNASGGHATLFKSAEMSSQIEAFQPEPARIAELSKSLRKQFDPNSILNPGRMTKDPVGA